VTVGILSFGSLLHDPGPELAGRIIERVAGVQTPFAAEFARSSRTRDGGPTLVPVDSGGSQLPAGVLLLEEDVDLELATELLYRRESRRNEDSGGRAAAARWIRRAGPLAGADDCIYVALPPNVSPLTPARLAELAVASAAAPAGGRSQDGISYLREQKERGVITPLMPAYEAEILARTGTSTLRDAWSRARNPQEAP
jgi:hypothetical protein